MVSQDRMTNWDHYFSTNMMPMTLKLGRMLTYLDGIQLIKPYDILIILFCKIMWQTNTMISPLPECLCSKMCQMMTYPEQILTIKSHDHMIMWSCQITWDTKIIIYPLPQIMRLPNLAVCEYTMRNFLP